MLPDSGVKGKKPEVDSRRSTFNIKEPERVNWKSMGLNSTLVITNALDQIGQATSVLGLQHAAILAGAVFSTLEVCG